MKFLGTKDKSWLFKTFLETFTLNFVVYMYPHNFKQFKQYLSKKQHILPDKTRTVSGISIIKDTPSLSQA